MPNRILKDSICSSDDINALDWAQEAFWYRLIVQCDDYGRMDARPAILRARCYPLAMDRVSEADITTWLHNFEQAHMVQLYTVAERPYLKITSWDKHQQVRAKRSKYPDMISDDINGNQLQSDAPEDENPNPNPKENPNPDEDENHVPRADGKGLRPSRSSSPDLGTISTAYEKVLGQMLTPGVGDTLWDWLSVEQFPAAWIVDAMQTAMLQNVRTLKYVKGILVNWRKEGKANSNGNQPAPAKRKQRIILPDGEVTEVEV